MLSQKGLNDLATLSEIIWHTIWPDLIPFMSIPPRPGFDTSRPDNIEPHPQHHQQLQE
jgi:hypothetical protein